MGGVWACACLGRGPEGLGSLPITKQICMSSGWAWEIGTGSGGRGAQGDPGPKPCVEAQLRSGKVCLARACAWCVGGLLFLA